MPRDSVVKYASAQKVRRREVRDVPGQVGRG